MYFCGFVIIAGCPSALWQLLHIVSIWIHSFFRKKFTKMWEYSNFAEMNHLLLLIKNQMAIDQKSENFIRIAFFLWCDVIVSATFSFIKRKVSFEHCCQLWWLLATPWPFGDYCNVIFFEGLFYCSGNLFKD